ncbi:hypothetical protein NIES267_15960 [Calothrix parasitica NIES-267]|uniref:Uncharacterized protein n=1 Tax=Calothrix parasitica NIES-267 TaxID=1973488 RepID=A0A1Z4LLZ5_9CYAN|nr:hypothetical protein NIES267_15960 [Calothrix parasitica NIES-267]
MTSNRINIFEAIQTGESSQIIELINQGINLNQEIEDEETPLSKAIKLGNINIIILLIESGADCEQLCLNSAFTPLSLACELGNKEIVQLLVDRKRE